MSPGGCPRFRGLASPHTNTFGVFQRLVLFRFDPEERPYAGTGTSTRPKPFVIATDRDYEEHFRSILREAVRRRITSTKPVLAELSGGLDSSSIVCIADSVLAWRQELSHRGSTPSRITTPPSPIGTNCPMHGRSSRNEVGPDLHIDIGPEFVRASASK